MGSIDNEYLTFVEEWPESRKTAIVHVAAAHGGAPVGRILWWGGWRQYVFMPEPNTILTVGCLETIQARVEDLMERRLANA